MIRRLLLALAFAGLAVPAAGQRTADDIELFVLKLEELAGGGNTGAITALGRGKGDTGVEDFASLFTIAPSRTVIKERDRTALEGGVQRLLLEVFVERGSEARVSTWRMDLEPATSVATVGGTTQRWLIGRLERLSVVSGLYRLGLDAARQFDIRNLTLSGPDLTLEIPSGTAFLAETPEGPTAVVLIGRGQMRFTPPDPAERTQLRIFSGSEILHSDFDAAFVRIRPSEFEVRFRAESLVPRAAVSPADVERARDVFEEYVSRTLHIDLQDLSRDRWSLVPNVGDLIAEVRTRRHGSLTYARAWSDAEDISLFDRRRRRNISVYASEDKLKARGRFYSEDDLVDYDVLEYDLDAAFEPGRRWITGVARVTLRVRAPALSTVTLKLAETLSVRGVYSPEFGRLLHLRVVGQNSLIVNLPEFASRGNEVRLQVVYSGRIEPQELDREAIQMAQDPEPMVIPLEPRYIYSNRSYWYPQSTVTDYATAKMRITVPAEYDVVASGVPVGDPAPAPGPVEPGSRPPRVFVFSTDRPARYLSCVISRFSIVTSAKLEISAPEPLHAGAAPEASVPFEGGPDPATPEPGADASIALVVQANPRQTGRARSFAERAADIIEYYASVVGEAPYPSFTLAVTESDLPGGHSPPYFAVLNQTIMGSPAYWRNDPVSFDNYPSFFLAHELAHQWWGQAIGWKNYHEQWISEGFAQYFAALYAERERGSSVFLGLLRQMRKWSLDQSDQGPVYLGYRLGHIRGDGRIYRALIYNKAAMVLHMLRRMVGDEAFFAGVRGFFTEWRFRKAGTDDVRVAMEGASRQDLSRFFEAWIYGSAIPRLKFSYSQPQAGSVLVRFEHRQDVLPLPVTVTITYTDGRTDDVVVAVTERVVERTLPLKGTIRKVEVNQDYAAVAEFER
jgi:hypothetical protein